MLPDRIKEIWLNERRKNNRWLNQPEVQELIQKGGSDAVEFMSAALKTPDRQAQEGAAYALGELGDVRAIEPLIYALRERWEPLRYEVLEALGKLDRKTSIEILVQNLQNP